MLVLNGKVITHQPIGGDFPEHVRKYAVEVLEPTVKYEPEKWFRLEERVRITDKRVGK